MIILKSLHVNLEYWIAQRTSKSTLKGEPSVIMRVAVLSVALSVAVMILSLAIVFGFHREITTKLSGVSAHIDLTTHSGLNNSNISPITKSEDIESFVGSIPKVEHMSPYATIGGVVRSNESVDGVILKGVDPNFDWSFLNSCLTEGETPNVTDERNKDILISAELAKHHRYEVGDRVEIILTDKSGSLRRDLFHISGIYSLGLGGQDKLLMVTDIRNVQRLNDWDSTQITGYDITLSDMSKAQKTTDLINEKLLNEGTDEMNNAMAYSIEEFNPMIYGWMATHNVNALVIIIIMIVVAGFNMATALLIMVMERTRMIGTLKSLGMNNKQLRQIFIYKAWSVILKGLAWGNGVGLGLALLQHFFHIIKLDESGYMLSYVPIELGVWWILLLNAVVAGSILALMTIPSRMVAYIKPEVTLKY